MQSLQKNIKNGLITLGVVVAVMAMLLTPGFFNAAFLDPFVTANESATLAGPALEDILSQSAEVVLGFIQKTSLR